MNVNDQLIDSLITLIEEGSRATDQSVTRFIEPARGTLQRATSKRHHIVFGRRGSGKTSLLKKAYRDLAINRVPISFVDLEPFKGHHYPDVLISVLIASFNDFVKWIDTIATFPSTRRSFWDKIVGGKPKEKGLNKEKLNHLRASFADIIAELNTQLHLDDEASLEKKELSGKSAGMKGALESSIGKTGVASATATLTAENLAELKTECTETTKRSKINYLYRNIINYKNLLNLLCEVSGNDAFLFLDDFYHIRRTDQIQLLDYFHRLAKGSRFWLKVGTIRHRSQWYLHGDPPQGLKLGDDADEINLDLTLEKYSLAKDFLVKILQGFIKEINCPSLHTFITPGAIDRLVLASGGVARDFLGIFKRSIDEARERLKSNPKHARGEKIGSEDVNLAAGHYGETKKEEFNRDTQEDRTNLEKEYSKIIDFCINTTNANCFLVDHDLQGKEINLIEELVDLRSIHLVRSRVTVSSRKGKLYKAYMLDVSQYTGARKRRDLQLVSFWKTGSEEELRKATLIFEISN